MLKKRKAFLMTIAVLCIFVMAFAVGCGGGNNNTEENGQPGESNGGQAAGEKETVNIISGSSGGVWYLVGSGMTEVINKFSDELKANSEPSSGGSVESMRVVDRRDCDFGFATSIVAWQAANGEGDFDQKYENLRIGMYGAQGYEQIVVRADSDIKSIPDLKGKKIAIGFGAALNTVQEALEPYGLILNEDYEAIPLSTTEMPTSLQDGVVDAISGPYGLGVAMFQELATTVGIRLLPFEEEITVQIGEEYPYNMSNVIIPAGTYTDQEEDITTFGVPTVVVTHKDVPEDVVYEFVKTIFENTDELTKIHPTGIEYSLDHGLYKGTPFMPLHPGLEKYLNEQGII